MKSVYNTLYFWLVCVLFLSSCSNDGGEGSASSGFAPEEVVGREFCFYSNPPRWSVRVTPGVTPTTSGIRVNSDYALVVNPAVYYQKIGDDMASLSFNFGSAVNVGMETGFTYHEYNLELTFTSPNQGYYSGTYSNEPMGGKVQNTSGYFSFDTDELPDFGGDTGEGNEDKIPEAFVGTWWFTDKDNGEPIDITIHSDGTANSEGDFCNVSFEEDTQKLIFDYGDGYPDVFTVLSVSSTKLVLQDEDGYTYTGKKSDGSDPEEGISDELYVDFSSIQKDKFSFRVAYKYPDSYRDPDDYLRAGICFATHEHPVITDDSTPQAVVVPESNSYGWNNTELKSGTDYYVRPYSIGTGGKVTYYQEAKIQTVGKDIVLTLRKTQGTSMEINYEINREGVFNMVLNYWTLSGFSTPEKYGYKTQGDYGTYTYTHPFSWDDGSFFYVSLYDINAGYAYESEYLHE